MRVNWIIKGFSKFISKTYLSNQSLEINTRLQLFNKLSQRIWDILTVLKTGSQILTYGPTDTASCIISSSACFAQLFLVLPSVWLSLW